MKITSLAIVMGMTFSPTMALGTANPVTVMHPWFRYLLPQSPAGGFMILHNPSDAPIVLDGVRSPACGMAMLHQTVSSSGAEAMTIVKTITVPANGDFAFPPGGYHVMCMEPEMKVGETVPVTLLFQNALPVTAKFPVYGASGPKASP